MSLLELPDGRRIGYEQHGKGPDIVWISGGGLALKDWLPYQVSAFPNYRNTVFDNRGIGESGNHGVNRLSLGPYRILRGTLPTSFAKYVSGP